MIPDLAAGPSRVLIVDDERHNRQLLEVMLGPEGFELMTASSGEEALALVAKRQPDLILLDIMMPGLDGYQVTRQIKGDPATRNIPIIMVTAFDDRQARMLGLNAGAEDFLTKPVDRAELCARVRNLLRLKAYGDYHDRYGQLLEVEVGLRTADLVERTRALEQQTAALSEQATLLDLAQDAIVVCDMQRRILLWNHGAEVMYGWSRDEVMGASIKTLLKSEYSEPFAAIEESFLSSGRWEGEVVHHKRDGTPITVASRWTLERDLAGAPMRVLTIHNDISDRKRAVCELLLLTERLSLATAAARVGVWEWDLSTNAVTWNATMFDIYGFAPDDGTVQARWIAAVHPDDLATVEATLKKAIDEKTEATAEFRITRADGAIRTVSMIDRVRLDEFNTVRSIIGVNIDITERKQAEAELRTAKNAAEAANRAKGEFLANMSHEIRTPMNGVIGMTELVLSTTLTAEQREYLGIVKSSSHALLVIINDILDFSRIEAGKLELDPIEFTPRDTIGDTAHTVALRAHQKGLELTVNVAAAVPQTLIGDPGRLRQILVNLLGNAIKFTHKGEIVLDVTRETMSPVDVVLHFSIRDTGVGIALERQDSVFAAFTQADGSITRTYGGTGLGLTISSQLVQLMGGRLWVDSEAGSGSTFHFTARFPAVAVAAVTPAVPDAVDLQDMAVLVVDGNVTSRRLLGQMLIGWRMVPTLVATMSEALATLRTAQGEDRAFDLVVTDFQVSEADGFTLAHTIKTDPAIAGATVVMLTSAGSSGDALRCRELGIAAYLPKPTKGADLRAAIVLALGGRSTERDRPALVTRHMLRELRQNARILLVEDNRVNQLVARRLLEKRGYTVIVANNGREALTILGDATPGWFACVLMDVQMPEMGGFECTTLIRDNEQISGQRLPIIAMTAHAMKGDDARCLAAGMDAYLSKPIVQDELFDVIERQLRASRVSVEGRAQPLIARPGQDAR
jgi:PAS domain S-box-containing protein